MNLLGCNRMSSSDRMAVIVVMRDHHRHATSCIHIVVFLLLLRLIVIVTVDCVLDPAPSVQELNLNHSRSLEANTYASFPFF
mgnify:CR=1 FL=1